LLIFSLIIYHNGQIDITSNQDVKKNLKDAVMIQAAYKSWTNTIALVAVFVSVAIVLWGCQTSTQSAPEKVNKEILQQWQGDLPVSKLILIPAESHEAGIGYINDVSVLNTVWPYFQPNTKVPNIDFKQHIIVYHYNTQFYNRNRIFKVEVSSGVAEVLAMETMSALPIEDKVAFSMVVITRKGINSLKTRDGLKTIQPAY